MKKLTEMGDLEKEKWNTEKMREHRNNWSLAADTQLLHYMQQFSQNLLSETHSTLKAVDTLESQVATTCVEVNNLGSRFWALSDTQFVESRVYDDDDTSATTTKIEPEEDRETKAISRIKEALNNGFQVLDTKFEMIQVPVSDSDDDDSSPNSGVVMKPINRYKDRPLPHLIGTAEFRSDNTLGLRDPQSDEETDEFMSTSDKAYDESEESDIESDHTKSQDLPGQNEDNILKPHAVISPTLMQTPVTPSSVLIGGMFEESDKDLFDSQPAGKKPLFTSWQQSDLWTPDEDTQKVCDDNSATHRPSSVASSVSSAQSSNISEPVKKNSENFGKSGSGRMPVLVQEDRNDVFISNSQVTQNKKAIPAGGIKIFHGDFNPFLDKKHIKDASSDDSEHSQQDRLEDNDEDDLFAKSQNISSKSLYKSSLPTSKLPEGSKLKKETDLFSDESDGDLFSNSVSIKSNLLKSTSQNVSNTHILTHKTLSSISRDDLPQRKSILFGDSEEDTENEHSLFSSKSSFFNPKSKDLFSDNIFKSDSENGFSNSENNSAKDIFVTKEVDSLFPSNKSSCYPKISESPSKSKMVKAYSPREIDLFGDIGISEEDNLFGSPNIPKQVCNQSIGNTKDTSLPHANNLTISKLWENDDEHLFSISNTSVPSVKHTSDVDSSFNNKNNILKGDLFSSQKHAEKVKEKQDVSKLRKTLETRSLFESDSDDDLFSSPQGSLSSRKSVQIANASIEHKPKQNPVDRSLSERSKTDFSTIFSNDSSQHSSLTTTNSDVFAKNEDDIFEENSSLSSVLKSDIKTPDLFKTISKTSTQIKENLDGFYSKKKDNKGVVIEAINPQIVSSVEKQHSGSNVEDIFAESSDLYKDIAVQNVEVVNVKKSEPPKTLDIKHMSTNVFHSVKKIVSESDQNLLESKKFVNKSDGNKYDVSGDDVVGDISTPSSGSRTVPGKLRSSQLLNINPAALLPGVKPQLKVERSSESEVETNSVNIHERSMDSSQKLTTTKTEPFLTLHSSKSEPSISTRDENMHPPMSGLLMNVNKERAKIQGKRRPSSRRARKDAIRASSVETGEETTNLSPPVSSNLMSPSTDEEDLFSVPPLDVITDGAKLISPKTDIFGTPTVLSPVVKEVPSPFVSTPFISSQPPPLDDDEDAPTQDDDIFSYQNNLFGNLLNENMPLKSTSNETSKVDSARDLFSNVDEDSLFSDIREAPPPLIMDDEDDENYNELFMSIDSKRKDNSSMLSFTTSPNLLVSEGPPSISQVVNSSMAPFPYETSNDPSYNSPISSNRFGNNLSSELTVQSDKGTIHDSLVPESKKHSDKLKSENLLNENVATPDKSELHYSTHDENLFTDLFSSPSAATTLLDSDRNADNILRNKTESQNSPVPNTTKGMFTKKDTLFSDDDDNDSDSLFMSGSVKITKSEPSLRPSLFGVEDDDDTSIFGSSTLINKKTSPPQGSSS